MAASSRIGPWISLGSLFGVVLGAAAWELAHGHWPGRGVTFSVDRWADGSYGREVEQELAGHSASADLLRPLYHQVLWDAFRECPATVVRGSDGWLFLASTVRGEPLTVFEQSSPEILRRLRGVADWIETRGVPFEMLVVPDKATLHSERLSALRPPLRVVYPRLAQQLTEAGIPHVDPRAVLSELGERSYLRTDTHWRPEGAVAVAELLAARLRERLGEKLVPRFSGELRRSAPISFVGDLARMLGLSDSALRARDITEEVVEVRGYERGGEQELGHAADGEVLLCGTSFAATGFGGVLAASLGVEVDTRGGPGVLPAVELVAALEDWRAGRRPAPSAVVWELPERYFFLGVSQLVEPLGAFLGRANFAGSTEAFEIASFEHRSAQLEESGPGVYRGRGRPKDPVLEFTLRDEKPADGRFALHYRVRAQSFSATRVWFDFGDGFGTAFDHQELLPRAGEEHEIFVPVPVREGRSLRRVRIVPAMGSAPFQLDGLEWRSREP